jgi:phytanoyl-CoA dioxygenase PhyH
MTDDDDTSTCYVAISETDRKTFETDGCLIVRNALSARQLDVMTRAVDEVYAECGERGLLEPGGRLHLLGAVFRRTEFVDLLDLPATFPHIWDHLGWNVFVYHSHLDVDPPSNEPADPVWKWHQDGYRQNVDLDDDPRPRLTIKVAYALSDLSRSGHGGTLFIPGSHLNNTLEKTAIGPDNQRLRPPGTVELAMNAGDAFIFDRRLWHSRSTNRSATVRKMVFVAYAYRWIRSRDDVDPAAIASFRRPLSPVRRQLLGEGPDAASFYGFASETGMWDDDIPLRAALKRHGHLDQTRHHLR